MTEPQGECWIRILSKITGRDPWTHGPFEVADVVIYALERGIYFVIKAEPITKQRGEGDVLHRQCTTLLSNDHALVLYWNPFDTAPMVVENIRKIASSMSTNSRFEVVDKKYVRQIYKSYKSKYSKDVESISKKMLKRYRRTLEGNRCLTFKTTIKESYIKIFQYIKIAVWSGLIPGRRSQDDQVLYPHLDQLIFVGFQ